MTTAVRISLQANRAYRLAELATDRRTAAGCYDKACELYNSAAILAAAAGTNTVAWGALLLIMYSLGLGIPFILLALGIDRAQGSFEWLRRHGRHIEIVGGALMVVVGVLFVSGAWAAWLRPLQRIFAQHGWPPF